jgi:hypothetical protein
VSDMANLTPNQREILDLAYERAPMRATGNIRTLRSLHARGLVTEPTRVPQGLDYAYLTRDGEYYASTGQH